METPAPFVEPTPRHVKVLLGDEVVADSTHALLVNRYGKRQMPTYAFPEADVRTELLSPSDAEPIPDTSAHDVKGADDVATGQAFRFEDLPEPLAEGNGHWTFEWDQDLRWFEEAQEVHVHARSTNHRVDAVPSDRHVQVFVEGELVADSHRPVAVFETSLPTRWYLPKEDVRMDLLEATDSETGCPYKGFARYWSVRTPKRTFKDIVWAYDEPLPEVQAIRGLVSFYNERVDLVVDGEHVGRPQTEWSKPDEA
jgi:uncharacterized protein (DUF427 family)